MKTYRDRLVTEATLQYADNAACGILEAIRATGHLSLATMAREPATIAAVNNVRGRIPKERWEELNRPSARLSDDEYREAVTVLRTLPGYCCAMDAVSILARL